MPEFFLSRAETRVLGCLLEKERTTPENYPLSLHSLTAACNQSTNREPVVDYDEKTVEGALTGLREKKLATLILGAGSRVQKYRHKLSEHYDFEAPEMAIMCTLLLRGDQTPGELRARTERLFNFGSLEAVEQRLQTLAAQEPPLVRMLSARPGQKESRYRQLLSAEPCEPDRDGIEGVEVALPPSRVEELERVVAGLTADLKELREEFALFRKQFE